MHIPLVDLQRQYNSLKPEIDEAIASVMADSAFVLGKYTKIFEEKFAAYCGRRYCVGLNSGTDALFFAYRALGVKTGDEVITVANTFIATAEPLIHLGAKPVFVDIDPQTHLIDPALVEKAITKRTKAIVPVHLFGQICDMEAIVAIAEKHGLKVVEDCAQAHGALHRGKKAGEWGDIGIYSFYPGKNLGAFGDAGCIVTDDEEYAQLIRKLRDHGRSGKYEHEIPGYSSRMDGLQAAILSAKLPALDGWVKKRGAVAKLYNKMLSEKIAKPIVDANNVHAYHLYVIELNMRDEMLAHLRSLGIEAGVHYPIPLHRQGAFTGLELGPQSLVITEDKAKRILSLPIFPELTEMEINYICEQINIFADKHL